MDDSTRQLRHVQRQMRLLDLHLQLLRDRLCGCHLHGSCTALGHHCCPHLPDCQTLRRRALTTKLDLERRLDTMKRLAMTLNSCCDQNRLALVDAKGFDPRDVTVSVKDGKVTVSAEHVEDHSTALAKTSNYRKYRKEFSLPPGDDEVTYSLETKSLTTIEKAPRGCPHHCDDCPHHSGCHHHSGCPLHCDCPHHSACHHHCD